MLSPFPSLPLPSFVNKQLLSEKLLVQQANPFAHYIFFLALASLVPSIHLFIGHRDLPPFSCSLLLPSLRFSSAIYHFPSTFSSFTQNLLFPARGYSFRFFYPSVYWVQGIASIFLLALDLLSEIFISNPSFPFYLLFIHSKSPISCPGLFLLFLLSIGLLGTGICLQGSVITAAISSFSNKPISTVATEY